MTHGAPEAERTLLGNDSLKDRRFNLHAAPWWLFAIVAVLLFMYCRIATDLSYQGTFLWIIGGLGRTLYTTVFAFLVSLIIGLLAGLGRVARSTAVRNIATTYIEFVRGVPILVLIFTIAFAIVPMVSRAMGLKASAIAEGERAIIALALIYGAFLAEIFRAGIESVAPGQMEAARSLGMTHAQAMRNIILPQAIRNVLPAIGNDFIAMLKDSSLVSVLGVRDMTQLSRLRVSSTFRYEETYFILVVVYLSITLLLSILLQWLQRRMTRDR